MNIYAFRCLCYRVIRHGAVGKSSGISVSTGDCTMDLNNSQHSTTVACRQWNLNMGKIFTKWDIFYQLGYLFIGMFLLTMEFKVMTVQLWNLAASE